jgi:7-cyano-7-deazaguanine reductase
MAASNSTKVNPRAAASLPRSIGVPAVLTGQPDFGTITIQYIPDQKILESKSLKLYLWSYRQEGTFHEHVTNTILDDLVKALDPISCEVVGEFAVRGGISITVEVKYDR